MKRFSFVFGILACLAIAGCLTPAKAETVSPLPGVLPGKTVTVSCAVSYELEEINRSAMGDPQSFGVVPVCGAAINAGAFLEVDVLASFKNDNMSTFGFVKGASAGATLRIDENVFVRVTGSVTNTGSETFGGAARDYRNWKGSAAVGYSF